MLCKLLLAPTQEGRLAGGASHGMDASLPTVSHAALYKAARSRLANCQMVQNLSQTSVKCSPSNNQLYSGVVAQFGRASLINTAQSPSILPSLCTTLTHLVNAGHPPVKVIIHSSLDTLPETNYGCTLG